MQVAIEPGQDVGEDLRPVGWGASARVRPRRDGTGDGPCGLEHGDRRGAVGDLVGEMARKNVDAHAHDHRLHPRARRDRFHEHTGDLRVSDDGLVGGDDVVRPFQAHGTARRCIRDGVAYHEARKEREQGEPRRGAVQPQEHGEEQALSPRGHPLPPLPPATGRLLFGHPRRPMGSPALRSSLGLVVGRRRHGEKVHRATEATPPLGDSVRRARQIRANPLHVSSRNRGPRQRPEPSA